MLASLAHAQEVLEKPQVFLRLEFDTYLKKIKARNNRTPIFEKIVMSFYQDSKTRV